MAGNETNQETSLHAVTPRLIATKKPHKGAGRILRSKFLPARAHARKLIEKDASLSSHPVLAKAVATLDADRAEYLEKG